MKRPSILQIITILLSGTILAGCSKSNSNPTPKNAVTITSIDVNTGPYYTMVTISGTGFSATPANDQLFFNGKATTVTHATATSLYTYVPLGAGTGNVTLSVNNGATVTGPVFTYQVAEVVSPIAGSSSTIGSANGIGNAASFFQPLGIAVDASGNLYIADTNNNLIRKITPDGTVTTFAGGSSAGFNEPGGIAVDASGNIYVADTNNNLIKKITPTGQISTIVDASTGKAANITSPESVAIDKSGDIFVVSQRTFIKEITPAGVITTIPTSNSDSFYGLAIDASGNLFSADPSENVIYKITSGGAVVFAGNGDIIGGDLDGMGKSAGFYKPENVAVDADNNVFVADNGNDELRKITPGAVVTTVGGLGPYFYGPVTKSDFAGIIAIVCDNAGNTFIIRGNEIDKISTQ
jgi:streptogramin lyase